MITEKEYLKGRDKDFPLSDVQRANMKALLEVINKVRSEYNKQMLVTSGYRPQAINSNVKGAAKKSAHTSCEAIDIADSSGELYKWIVDNNILEKYNLYMEHHSATPTWTHLTTRAPKSGKRIFQP